MGQLDAFFKPGTYSHPRLRFWKSRAAKDGPPAVELLREFDGLSYGPANLYVTFRDSSGREDQYTETWNFDLDHAMMLEGWKGQATKDDAMRLRLALRRLFAPTESKYGDGYFSSVLVEYLNQSPFAALDKVRDVLKYVRENSAQDSQSKQDCRELIEASLGQVALVLKDNLAYSQEIAEQILEEALAGYLDERFSISAGKKLGLYSE